MFHRKTVKVPLYPATVDFVITDNWDGILDNYNFNKSKIDDDAPYAFYTVLYDKKAKKRKHVIVLNFNDSYGITHGVIAHEAAHFANWLLYDLKYIITADNDEPFTYLLGWAVNELYKFINELNLKVNNCMSNPKTIKGYITLLRRIESIPISHLKGYKGIDKKTSDLLKELSGQISNIINEIE